MRDEKYIKTPYRYTQSNQKKFLQVNILILDKVCSKLLKRHIRKINKLNLKFLIFLITITKMSIKKKNIILR